MQTFQYTAISKDGAKVRGVIEGFDEYDAVARIKENCSIVTKITVVEEKTKEHKDLFAPKITEKQLAMICSQFSIILASGLPIVRAVELIANQSTDKNMKKLLTQVAGDVSAGFGLAQSFENKGHDLPRTFIETIRSGESSGTLDSSFRRLHSYYDKSSKTKSKVKNAMVYPVFTIVVAIVVVIIIMVVAVPTFTSSFASMGIEMPLPTRVLIAISNFFSKYIILIAALAAGLGIALKIYGTREQGRLKYGWLKLKIPVLGKIALTRGAAQFANTMSTLLASGLSIIQAVEITGKVMDNYRVGTDLGSLVPFLEEGKPLGSTLKRCQFLPELLVEMTGVGEETGTLESTLDVIGAYYDNETELASSKALSLIEPVVICILAVVVCFILLSVYAPMFSLYGGI